MQPLPNHHPQWANAANDAGPLPASQPVEGLTLVLTRPPAQEEAFEQFLAGQQNPASADYHHWLTAAEIGDRFGRPDADVAAIRGWLQSQGLHVKWVAPSKTFIGFAGTAADVSRAFQTELHNYRVNGRNLVSVSSDPMVPQAVAPAIKAIRGLYTIEEEPQNQARAIQIDAPAITASNGENFIGPGDFYNIYSLPNGITGAGVTIGIVARSRTDAADFNNFKALLGTAFADPTEVVPTAFGGVDPGPAYTSPPGASTSVGDQAEATLDVERAGSVAQGANLLLVVASQASGGIEVDAQYLVQTVPAPAQVMNISFGACESSAGPSGVNFWDSLFQQAAAEGISSFVASGDSGASGCDTPFEAPPTNPQANSPSYICSSSYATCVGGTEFNDASSPAMYWQSYAGSIGTSAIGYIPEGGWNESWNGTTSTVAASGGGVSSVIATPAWQQGIAGVPTANAGRYTPDVAFSASEHDGYLGCFAAGGGSCVVSNGSIYFTVFSGTSAAAPSMAAIAAMLDQSVSSSQGNLNPGIYQMSISAPTAFHDVTLASSGVTSCGIDTPSLCNNSIPGPSGLSGGQAGYEVGTGYDEVTGLGSLDASVFVNAYPTASKIFTPTLAVSGDSTVATNEPFWVDVGASGAPYGPAPTGTFTLTIGSYTSTVPVPGNTYVIFNLAAGTVPIGNFTETAAYTPDAASAQIYAAASATAPLSVTVPPLVHPTLTLTPSQTIFANSEPITLALVVSSVQYYPNPTGSVTLTSGTYSSGPVVLVNQSATILIPAGSLAVGADILIVTYTPDATSASSYLTTTWNSASVQNEGATITPAVTPSVSPGNPTTAEALTISVSVDGFPGNPTPTGSVVVTTGNYTSAAATVSSGVARIGVAPGALPVGLDTLTATYTPDAPGAALYSSAWGSNSVGMYLAQIITPTVTMTPVTQNPAISQPLVLSVSVNGGAGAPVATGFVRIGTAAYGTVDAILAGGAAVVTLAAGSFGSGAIVVTGQYFPDSQGTYAFNTASGSTTVNVAKITPVLAIMPTPPSVSTQNSLQVEVDVNGPSGVPGANGTVSFTCGYYTSGPLSISNSTGSFISVTIPPGQLPLGTNTISAIYSGDNNYNAAMGTGTVTVTAPAGAAFTITDSSFDVTKGSGISNATGVLLTPTNGFVGTVTLTAAITASPADAQDLPTMTFAPASVNLADFNTETSTLTFTTTAASSAKRVNPDGPWLRWSGVTAPVLACLALWLVPVRRRIWRNLLLFAALAIFIAGGLAACGGSGSGAVGGGGGGGGGNSGTTSGQYTITITGTSGSMTETSTITLTVQ